MYIFPFQITDHKFIFLAKCNLFADAAVAEATQAVLIKYNFKFLQYVHFGGYSRIGVGICKC